jgi:hypothetical protein
MYTDEISIYSTEVLEAITQLGMSRTYGMAWLNSRVFQLMDHIFAKKEDAHLVPAVRLVTIWLGACIPTSIARPS